MIAFLTKRGRPVGSSNSQHNAVGKCTPGSSTSAAKVNTRNGVIDRRPAGHVWVQDEGWVSWREIERQVEEKYEEWRARCARQGRRVFDAGEWREANYQQALAAKKLREDSPAGVAR